MDRQKNNYNSMDVFLKKEGRRRRTDSNSPTRSNEAKRRGLKDTRTRILERESWKMSCVLPVRNNYEAIFERAREWDNNHNTRLG